MTSELERAWELVIEDVENRIEAIVERVFVRVLERHESVLPEASRDTRPVFNQGQRMTGEPVPGQTTSGWQKMTAASFKSGRVTRTIRTGSPVKVKGLGRGGGTGSGYEVTGLETRAGEVNVHVRKGREQERTVKLDRIIYVIPKRAK